MYFVVELNRASRRTFLAYESNLQYFFIFVNDINQLKRHDTIHSPMSDSTFQTLYKRLNKAQKQAVDTIDGPVMVIAGPGTGKTSILTLRIANIIKETDTAPENILALTFTESGAYAMRKKLVDIIGTAAYKVRISTFHGFCNEVIKEYPERFPRIIGSTAITEIDQIAILEKIIQDTKLELLKPFGDPMFYVRPVLGEIRKLKREAISPSEFKKGIEKQEVHFKNEPEKIHVKGAHKGKMKGEFVKLQEQIEKNKELLKLYTEYEKALVDGKFFDFEDMIVEVVKTLKEDGDLLLILQEQYQYILADEHQDANNAQNAILELLSNFHDNPNLFIVGDEKQAIFRFQGASLENFLYFKKLYPKAVLIHLEENYRSTQSILDASHSLISNNVGQEVKRVQLIARVEKGKHPIQIHEFPNIDAEQAFVAKDIERKIKAGVKLEEIVVLYRNNNDSFAVGYALEKLGIAFRVESDNDILKNEQIRKLLHIFEATNNLANEELLSKVLFIDFIGIKPLEAYKAVQRSRDEKKKLYEIVNEQFPDLSKMLNSWASLAHNKPFIQVFESIIRESGFLQYALQSETAIESLATLESFFEEVRTLAGARKEYYLKDFIIHLDRVREHGILTKTGAGLQKEGVRLMTAHRSKGLEFDYVYIVGAYDGHWGNKSSRTYFHVPLTAAASSGSIDDERRLFYVALTRARKEVVITYPSENADGRELLPAQFLGEIDENLKSHTPHNERLPIQEHFTKVSKIGRVDNKEYLQKLFLEQGLSVTHLNNYIRCPWEYFFVNLIRIPQAQTKHQMYGTAVHYTLKTFFDKYRIEEDMSKDEMLRLFEFNLHKMPLPPRDFEDTLEKGKESLGGYYDTYKGAWPRRLLNEYSIKGVHLETLIGTVLLKGNIDKLEFVNDREVHVIDYKTGKPKSKIDENYQRQLIFYKLLLDLDDKKKYEMVSGELDFVEPDDKGKFKKFKYIVSDIELKNLTELIKKTSEEIYNLTFWNTKCDNKDCEYCALGKLMK
jgi:DNA helicase-2/ATP-dependent DNA helicase PcrA